VLHPWRRAALPMVAALGSALLSLVLLMAFAPLFGEPLVAQGWAATFAVDIVFGYFLAIVIFRRHPSPALPRRLARARRRGAPDHDWLHDGAILCHRLGRAWRWSCPSSRWVPS